MKVMGEMVKVIWFEMPTFRNVLILLLITVIMLIVTALMVMHDMGKLRFLRTRHFIRDFKKSTRFALTAFREHFLIYRRLRKSLKVVEKR